jgi:hypothetical protein
VIGAKEEFSLKNLLESVFGLLGHFYALLDFLKTFLSFSESFQMQKYFFKLSFSESF